MAYRKSLLWAAGLLFLNGCTTLNSNLDAVYAETGNKTADHTSFTVCFAHGCTKRVQTGLDAAEWAVITGFFEPAPQSGADERAAIRLAIGQFERMVGAKTGTDADVGGSFTGLTKRRQLDCVDEMMNTATYVQLLINAGLVTHHEPGRRLTNPFFANGNVWPHTAMTIRDKSTGKEWAIDSWWLKNGAEPYIVTREAWSHSAWDRPVSAKAKKAAEAQSGVGLN